MLIVWVFAYKKLAQFAVRGALPPRRSESPACATDNKPSCLLHLLGWFIGSLCFSSLERRPEFWVLQLHHKSHFGFTSIRSRNWSLNYSGPRDMLRSEADPGLLPFWLLQVLSREGFFIMNYYMSFPKGTHSFLKNFFKINGS